MPATFATTYRKFIFTAIEAVIWKLALTRQIKSFTERSLHSCGNNSPAIAINRLVAIVVATVAELNRHSFRNCGHCFDKSDD